MPILLSLVFFTPICVFLFRERIIAFACSYLLSLLLFVFKGFRSGGRHQSATPFMTPVNRLQSMLGIDPDSTDTRGRPQTDLRTLAKQMRNRVSQTTSHLINRFSRRPGSVLLVDRVTGPQTARDALTTGQIPLVDVVVPQREMRAMLQSLPSLLTAVAQTSTAPARIAVRQMSIGGVPMTLMRPSNESFSTSLTSSTSSTSSTSPSTSPAFRTIESLLSSLGLNTSDLTTEGGPLTTSGVLTTSRRTTEGGPLTTSGDLTSSRRTTEGGPLTTSGVLTTSRRTTEGGPLTTPGDLTTSRRTTGTTQNTDGQTLFTTGHLGGTTTGLIENTGGGTTGLTSQTSGRQSSPSGQTTSGFTTSEFSVFLGSSPDQTSGFSIGEGEPVTVHDVTITDPYSMTSSASGTTGTSVTDVTGTGVTGTKTGSTTGTSGEFTSFTTGKFLNVTGIFLKYR